MINMDLYGTSYDNLEVIERHSKGKLTVGELKNVLSALLLVFKGRSIDDAILIIDEAQNLDVVTLRTILTSYGKIQ